MKKVLLIGCNGQMGLVVQQAILQHPKVELIAGIDRNPGEQTSFPIYKTLHEVKEEIDLVIDFSHHSMTKNVLDFCLSKQLPVVIATTGLSEELTATIQKAAEQIPVFYSANMSLGVNALIRALQSVAPILEEDFQIEMIEKHHRYKKDAPSGTALLLADSINDVLHTKKEYIHGRTGNENENNINEIGIHAVRGGSIPGEHTVIFAGEDELLEFKHTALSRGIFANGALKAGLFLVEQPKGFYSMNDLLQNT
ncbi:4-hydroxy-tetrahydrodipicolinate reductase [Enterococcus sp. LJL98]